MTPKPAKNPPEAFGAAHGWTAPGQEPSANCNGSSGPVGAGGVMFSRVWAMPNADTFSVQPIGDFVRRYLKGAKCSVDPFARNKRWATHTNDLNPKTEAEHHMDAEDFLRMLAAKGVRCDVAIFDPPYSPRQISECYKEAGITVGMKETQNAALYARMKAALMPVLTDDALVMSFGWNSAGMGKKHGFEQVEILLCCHGAAHNDTICMAERRAAVLQMDFFSLGGGGAELGDENGAQQSGAVPPIDPKLSDRGVRRGTCMVGGKAAAEAGAVTHGAVRCSAWLGDLSASILVSDSLQFGLSGC